MCVFFILMATCAEITIVMIYFQVRCGERRAGGGRGDHACAEGWGVGEKRRKGGKEERPNRV
jgi:hypothetical protein